MTTEPNPAYVEATDCPICPMVATDRDDALREADELRVEVLRLRGVMRKAAKDLHALELSRETGQTTAVYRAEAVVGVQHMLEAEARA